MLKPSETVQWLDGDAHRVGRVLREDGLVATDCGLLNLDLVVTDFGLLNSNDIDEIDDLRVLVQWSHTGELQFVEWGRLSAYPSSPIPDPSPLALLDAAYDYGGPG